MYVLLAQYLYRNLLRLFPRNFYAEFAEEMQSVFIEIVAEAGKRGCAAQVLAALRELACLPFEAVRLHLIPRYQNQIAAGERPAGWEGPPTRKEALLVLGVFALPLLGLSYRETGFFSTHFPAYLATGLVLGVVVAGFLKDFPRWSFPYLGLVFATAGFSFIVESGADQLAPQAISRLGIAVQDESTRLLLEAAWSGFLWFSLFSLIALGVGAMALFRRCRVIAQKIRKDWTLASYILYSGVAAIFGLSFARHISQDLYAVASVLCLGFGAWLFLTSSRAWQRALALLGGLTLAATVAAAGQWPLHPLHSWETALRLETSSRTGSTMVTLEWVWMSAVLLAPVLLRYLPWKRWHRTASP